MQRIGTVLLTLVALGGCVPQGIGTATDRSHGADTVDSPRDQWRAMDWDVNGYVPKSAALSFRTHRDITTTFTYDSFNDPVKMTEFHLIPDMFLSEGQRIEPFSSEGCAVIDFPFAGSGGNIPAGTRLYPYDATQSYVVRQAGWFGSYVAALELDINLGVNPPDGEPYSVNDQPRWRVGCWTQWVPVDEYTVDSVGGVWTWQRVWDGFNSEAFGQYLIFEWIESE